MTSLIYDTIVIPTVFQSDWHFCWKCNLLARTSII